MRRLVEWAVSNGPAMNVLMVTILAVGAASLMSMRREVFPNFELEIILVRVPYPGAAPAEVEEGICQKIEESVRAIEHVKKVTSVAGEGQGTVILELEASVPDVQRTLNEVRSEIDRIQTFPELAEDPEVEQITFRSPAIFVGVVGPTIDARAGPGLRAQAVTALREVTERVRDDLLTLPSISQANINAAPAYQIDVEVSEDRLREYGLSLQEVAQVVRRQNAELPGGVLRSESGVLRLRGVDKRRSGEGIADLPLVTSADGAVVTVGDVATVNDAFVDADLVSEIDGSPGLAISVDRTSNEDLLRIVDAVKGYVASVESGENPLPAGYRLVTWGDRSVDVKDRMDLLIRNGQQGLLLVFIVLALFLEIRLAFWVALGIPISMLGAGGWLLYADQTLNMLSMFAFLMALGIVVDDAIVVGENVYAHRQMGKDAHTAAVDGTVEVIPSVVASVTTTIIAFGPLMFVSGVMGKFIGVMPVAVIAMLAISLIESMTILPSHLSHKDNLFFALLRVALWPLRPLMWLVALLNRGASRLLELFIEGVYLPLLRLAMAFPIVAPAMAAGILILAIGFVRSGRVPFVVFPKLDANTIIATIEYPDGTPLEVTEEATVRIERAIRALNAEYEAKDQPLLQLTRRVVGQASRRGPGPSSTVAGSHIGSVEVELLPAEQRPLTSIELNVLWRERAGEFPGAESVKFGSRAIGPGGTPIEFQLLAPAEHFDELERAVERSKAKLATYDGVFDIADDSQPGKWELQLRVKPEARALGVTTEQLASAVRSGYFGAEAMRLQRGRHEVKLMVRYPADERASLAQFDDLRLRTGDGAERPLSELAEIRVVRGPSEITRVDQMRAITVSADLDETKANASEIVADMRADYIAGLLRDHPHVRVRWEGQQAQTAESVGSLISGLLVAMALMYGLLSLQFRSYIQPLLILAIIPFGAIGAIAGHWLLGLPMTLFSLFGLVALTGVVVNDSIVLIDFINYRLADGVPLKDALVDAGRRRFRPVLLTSLTTVAGLSPILWEKSFQAQILIPMATSLLFGLALATVLILVLVPVFYLLYVRGLSALERGREWLMV